MPLNLFDIVLLAFLLFAFVRGIIKGFFAEVAGLLALIGGVYFAINYSYQVVYWLEKTKLEWSHQTYKIVGFALTFILVALGITFIGKFLTKLADITALGLVNKLMGGLFGVLKVGLILSVLLVLFDKLNKNITFVEKEVIEESQLYEPIKNISAAIFPSIIKTSKDGEKTFEFPGKYK